MQVMKKHNITPNDVLFDVVAPAVSSPTQIIYHCFLQKTRFYIYLFNFAKVSLFHTLRVKGTWLLKGFLCVACCLSRVVLACQYRTTCDRTLLILKIIKINSVSLALRRFS